MLKRVLLVIAVLFLLVIFAGAGALAWVANAFPKVAAAPNLSIAATPTLLARGDYLFNHVCGCVDCHSRRDPAKLSGPPIPGSEGQGGEAFGAGDGIPGTIHARNITPAALGGWSDGELYRCLVTGVSKDGTALFPLMPYQAYATMARGDVEALVAYTRTLKPIANAVPERALTFPMNVIVKTIPRDVAQPDQAPTPADGVAYGKYLVTAASCIHCHSPSHHGKLTPGREFSGGVEFPRGGRVVRSANLTPDQTTGIGAWTREQFIERFAHGPETKGGAPTAYDTPMPWTSYAGMTTGDLGAIYDYLRALPAIQNPVLKVSAP
jgi:mono/diheme cytochrome c family protein